MSRIIFTWRHLRESYRARPAVLHYHKVGDKVIESGTATLNWAASNAETVQLDPIGPVVGTSGEQTISFTPSKSDLGPVDESRVYRITASNSCGGSDTTTAVVEVAGSIDPAEPVLVASSATTEPLPTVLPQTASPLPLIGLVGLVSLGLSSILRRFSKA